MYTSHPTRPARDVNPARARHRARPHPTPSPVSSQRYCRENTWQGTRQSLKTFLPQTPALAVRRSPCPPRFSPPPPDDRSDVREHPGQGPRRPRIRAGQLGRQRPSTWPSGGGTGCPIMRDAMHPGTASATAATSPLFGRFDDREGGCDRADARGRGRRLQDVHDRRQGWRRRRRKYPLVKQSMRTLWQHAVRKIIRQQATPADTLAAAAGGASGARARSARRRIAVGRACPRRRQMPANGRETRPRRRSALKRQSNSSPTTVLEDESNPEDGKGKADDNKAGRSGRRPRRRRLNRRLVAVMEGCRAARPEAGDQPHTAMVQGSRARRWAAGWRTGILVRR